MKSRQDRVKKGLDNDIYNKLNDIENLSDDTLSSTESLADILEGYETKVEGMNFTKPLEELEILDEEDIEIEIDNEEILHDYNNQVHGLGLNTLDDLLSTTTPTFNNEVDKSDDNIDKVEITNNVNEEKVKEMFTQNLVSPKSIDDFSLDELIIEPNILDDSTNQRKKDVKTRPIDNEVTDKQSDKTFDIKNHIIDIILVIILIFLVYFLITSNTGV